MFQKATILYRGLFGPTTLLVIRAFEFHPNVDDHGKPNENMLRTDEKDHFYNFNPASMVIEETGLDGLTISYHIGKVEDLSPTAQDADNFQQQTHIVWTETLASIGIIHENWKSMA